MTLNLPQKEEREKVSKRIKRWTDTGWMYMGRGMRKMMSPIMKQIDKDIEFKRKAAMPSKEIMEHYRKIRMGK